MNKKKLVVFLMWAFLPMIIVGLVMSSIADAASGNPMTAIIRPLMSAGAMFIPLLAVIITQLIFKEPVLKDVGISFKLNKWWWIGWLLMPLVAILTLGATLLMPGAKWTPDSELMQQALQSMPEGIGVWGLIGITLLSGLFAGLTINAVFALGEEVAWRGFLMREFKGKSFWSSAIWIGVIWGLWHAPLILNGHNYPQHPLAGVFMMVVFCILLSVMLMYFREKSGSVIVAAIMHGTINAVAGITMLVVTPANDLLNGATGLAGMIVLLIVDAGLYLYDKSVGMNKRSWFIPILIVAVNVLAVIVKWRSLPDPLPAHFDLQGNASGTMPRNMLILYVLIGAAICLIAYLIGRKKRGLQTGLVVLTSGICLVLLLSTMVTLTSGAMPVFMLAEPVVLLAAVVGFVVAVVKSYKKRA